MLFRSAKRVIFLFMNGGPSHVDTFDPKPSLVKYSGQTPDVLKKNGRGDGGKLMPTPFNIVRYGKCGIEATDLYPEVGSCMDDICVVRSMYTDNPNHEPALLMMNSGNMQPIRPSMGSWITYGLGTENQNLPGFITICPTLGHGGVQNWSSAFLPAAYQGTPIGNASVPASRASIDYIKSPDSPPEIGRAHV